MAQGAPGLVPSRSCDSTVFGFGVAFVEVGVDGLFTARTLLELALCFTLCQPMFSQARDLDYLTRGRGKEREREGKRVRERGREGEGEREREMFMYHGKI